MSLETRREAAQAARMYETYSPVFLDTETTGTGPNAEVIELAVLGWQGEVLFESLVKPRGRIESGAYQVHGISDSLLVSAPQWGEVWREVEPILKAKKIGAYNSDFDLRLLRQTQKLNGLSWQLGDDQFFCVMKLYARFAGNWDTRRGSYRWHSLDAAGQQCGIPLPNSHRARDDASLARAVFKYISGWQS